MKKILLVGANGFIATEFMKRYKDKYMFICVTKNGQYTLDLLESRPDIVLDVDIVLNLAGANIGTKRWTESRKQELLDSRIVTTTRLVNLFNRYNPNAHLVNASAIGIYEINDLANENTHIEFNHYSNFSMQIVKQWEKCVHQYKGDATITRFGVVLSSHGGAFIKMLKPFLFGVGGKLGEGNQFFPWISLYDLLNILDKIMVDKLFGVFNLVAPELITNSKMTDLIGQLWYRPKFFNMPEYLIKLLFGQMGQELFLNSIKVESLRLKNFYVFTYPTMKDCLIAIKKRIT